MAHKRAAVGVPSVLNNAAGNYLTRGLKSPNAYLNFSNKHLPNKSFLCPSWLNAKSLWYGFWNQNLALFTYIVKHCFHFLWFERLLGISVEIEGSCLSHFLKWLWENIYNVLSLRWLTRWHAILSSMSDMHFRFGSKYPDKQKGHFQTPSFSYFLYIFFGHSWDSIFILLFPFLSHFFFSLWNLISSFLFLSFISIIHHPRGIPCVVAGWEALGVGKEVVTAGQRETASPLIVIALLKWWGFNFSSCCVFYLKTFHKCNDASEIPSS